MRHIAQKIVCFLYNMPISVAGSPFWHFWNVTKGGMPKNVLLLYVKYIFGIYIENCELWDKSTLG